MKKVMRFVATLGCAVVLSFTVIQAQSKTSSIVKDEVNQSEKAAKVFTEIMNAPDKAIPAEILGKTECIAVFPQVIKAGFIVGGRGGRGVASCRIGDGWSAPAYFNMSGGSIGLQIGAQATDFVLLFVTKDGINSLLSSKFTVGGDASVAAGPVGREAGASTDAKLNAQILTYSRSKGLFAGVELNGVAITPDKDDMRDVYGEGVTAKEVLKENKTASGPAQAFPNALSHLAKRDTGQ